MTIKNNSIKTNLLQIWIYEDFLHKKYSEKALRSGKHYWKRIKNFIDLDGSMQDYPILHDCEVVMTDSQ
jgi:hypothetical protein